MKPNKTQCTRVNPCCWPQSSLKYPACRNRTIARHAKKNRLCLSARVSSLDCFSWLWIQILRPQPMKSSLRITTAFRKCHCIDMQRHSPRRESQLNEHEGWSLLKYALFESTLKLISANMKLKVTLYNGVLLRVCVFSLPDHFYQQKYHVFRNRAPCTWPAAACIVTGKLDHVRRQKTFIDGANQVKLKLQFLKGEWTWYIWGLERSR